MKMEAFGLEFDWTFFQFVQLKYASIDSDNGLVQTCSQVVWTNDSLLTHI